MWRRRPSKSALKAAAASANLPHLLPVQDLPHILEGRGNLYTPHGHFVQSRTTHVQTLNDDDFQPSEAVTFSEAEPQALSKKQKQFLRWEQDILPSLLAPYIKLLRETDSLRTMDGVRQRRGCEGCHKGKLLRVSCILFDSEWYPSTYFAFFHQSFRN
jgi:hypothetical protein